MVGKVCVVTGATSGIGKATATALAGLERIDVLVNNAGDPGGLAWIYCGACRRGGRGRPKGLVPSARS